MREKLGEEDELLEETARKVLEGLLEPLTEAKEWSD